MRYCIPSFTTKTFFFNASRSPVRSKTTSGRPSTTKASLFTRTRLGLSGSTITGSLSACPSKASLYFCKLASFWSASTISFNDFSGGGL
ncbi:hypothetical protein X975_16625, partial [Stegodyphus mimosarum]